MAKILIVEDDSFLNKMYAKKFEVEGYEVQTAADGLEGLEKMRSFHPDMVLMDVMMPRLDGLSALAQAKADPGIKDIPIVILTNLSTEHDSQDAVNKGAVAHIVKSNITPSQLVDRVIELLSPDKQTNTSS